MRDGLIKGPLLNELPNNGRRSSDTRSMVPTVARVHVFAVGAESHRSNAQLRVRLIHVRWRHRYLNGATQHFICDATHNRYLNLLRVIDSKMDDGYQKNKTVQ